MRTFTYFGPAPSLPQLALDQLTIKHQTPNIHSCHTHLPCKHLTWYPFSGKTQFFKTMLANDKGRSLLVNMEGMLWICYGVYILPHPSVHHKDTWTLLKTHLYIEWDACCLKILNKKLTREEVNPISEGFWPQPNNILFPRQKLWWWLSHQGHLRYLGQLSCGNFWNNIVLPGFRLYLVLNS